MVREEFYLKSKENQYPPDRYPIIHSIYAQTVRDEIEEKLGELKNLMPIIVIILIGTFLYLVCRQEGHIKVYNVINGPFHMNLSEFIEHVESYKRSNYFNMSFITPIRRYLQVEFGEGNIQNPANSETIRQYLNPETRKPRQHIATFKELKIPEIYVKLPTRNVPQVHEKFAFDFNQFSDRTLECILNTLLTKNNAEIKFAKKSEDIINYIEKEYSKNSTSFNMLILTKCGILIGYLTEPLQKGEKAFIPTEEYIFNSTDIVFDASAPYFLIDAFLAVNFGLFIASLGCYIYYYSICFIYKRSSFSLWIKREVTEKLKLLNFSGLFYEQLLKMDELIAKTGHHFKNRLFIIEGDFGNYFVVILPVNRGEMDKYKKSNSFSIYPVSTIQSVQIEGIYYLNDFDRESRIKWPTTSMKEKKKYAAWLHEKLLEISDSYRDVIDREELQALTQEEEIQLATRHPLLAYCQLHPNWFGFLEHFIIGHPLTAREIAKFRLKNIPTYVNETIQGETCTICQENFVLNEQYTIWPCSSQQHLFHYDCILEQYRTNNSCPMCREPAQF